MMLKRKISLITGIALLALAGCKEDKQQNVLGNNADSAISALTNNTSDLTQEAHKAAYAAGATFAQQMKESLLAQQADFDKDYVIAGFVETYTDKGRLDNPAIEQVLSTYSKKLETAQAEKLKQAVDANIEAGKKFREEFEKQSGVKKTDSGLLYKIDNPGDGKIPLEKDTIIANYRGKLVDGREFDSSYSRNEPLTFPLNGVIKGWTEGIQLLNEGGKGTFVLPPELGYEDMYIPANGAMAEVLPQSTLIYEIEFIKIKGDDVTEPVATENKKEESKDTVTTDTNKNKQSQKSTTDKTKNTSGTEKQPAESGSKKETQNNKSGEEKPSNAAAAPNKKPTAK